MTDAADSQFTTEELLSFAQGNATAFVLATFAYLKEQGLAVEDYVRFFGSKFASGWEELRDRSLAVAKKVVSRYTAKGTHKGEFFGVAPTGNRIEMSGIQIDRFDESGKMVEEWPEYDLLGAMKQMGAV